MFQKHILPARHWRSGLARMVPGARLQVVALAVLLAAVLIIQPSDHTDAAGAQGTVILIPGLWSEYTAKQVANHDPQARFTHLWAALTDDFPLDNILFFSYELSDANCTPAFLAVPVRGTCTSTANTAYECTDTTQDINKSVSALANLIRQQSGPVTIVGHSLGGLIAFEALELVREGNDFIPLDKIRQVITIDSPLEGAESLGRLLVWLATRWGISCPGEAVTQIDNRTPANNRAQNTDRAVGAVTRAGTLTIVTMANVNDCVYNTSPKTCAYAGEVEGDNGWQRQIVYRPMGQADRIKVRRARLPAQQTDTIGHGSYLSSLALARHVQALILAGFGKAGGTSEGGSAGLFFSELTGTYSMLWTLLEGTDCYDELPDFACGGQPDGTIMPGIYMDCIAELLHDPSSNAVTLRPYCYIDSPDIVINPEAYPGAVSDGMAGGPPPGPQVASYASGFPSWAYGDVDEFHTELTGTFNKTTNLIEVSGCMKDQDGFGSLGNVWVELTVSADELLGTVEIYPFQTENCEFNPFGSPLVADAVVAHYSFDLSFDSDDDGVPDSRELQDDAACGRRDPYNENDYYDVSVPRDGVIDLSNDILGVIQHYAPGGYVTGTPDVLGGIPDVTTVDNFDRPPTMTGGAGTWNRGSPDGVIDLSNDILGVILQYNPGGCPPLS